MQDILIYNGKNMDLVDWLPQIEKVTLLTNSQEYRLAMAKINQYSLQKLLKRIRNDLTCRTLEEN